MSIQAPCMSVCAATTIDKESIQQNADLIITTAEELNEFAEEVNNGNNFAGEVVVLGNDIVFDNTIINNFTPIGNTENTKFSGTFDGCAIVLVELM